MWSQVAIANSRFSMLLLCYLGQHERDQKMPKPKAKTKKEDANKRVQIDMPDDMRDSLDEIKEHLGIRRRAELVRFILGEYIRSWEK